ncbi:hypothetical protein Daesc_006299 [Daldinia eschscholtzii]|uniref:Clr5 domain-containing protein n=1 Tax=Daldinia eschscholtzii TaxID=292717 RepID=A0AAX6MH48_9PEZI
MATKARKIPQNDWDHHKETILNLYLTSDLSVDQLVPTMDQRHGFRATISQYEAQFRVWNARKNLKVHEWEGIFEIIDDLSSRDTQSRVVISGHPVSPERVHRARRHCNRETRLGKRRRVETGASNASDDYKSSEAFIEVQKPNGEWCQYTPCSTNQMNQDDVVELVAQERTIDIDINQCPQESVDSSLRSVLSHTSQSTSDNWPESNEGINIVHPTECSTSDPEPQVSQDLIQFDFDADIISPGVEMVTSSLRLDAIGQFSFGTLCINDLPFERFERDSVSKRLVLALNSSPLQESALLFGPQTLVTKFVVEVATVMSETNEMPPGQNVNKVWFTLQKLRSILPRTQQASTSTELARPQHEILEVELHRILLFSIANGFVGLDGIPLKLVFKFLDQHSNVNSLLSRWFQGTPDSFAKGLAEKLFRASIEAGNHQAVRFFLQKRLVDVNNTFCFIHGQIYTPLERAAKLQELKVIHELLQAGPDVNVSRLDTYDQDGLEGRLGLGCLIYVPKFIKDPNGCWIQYRSDRIFRPEYMKTVDALIDAGIKVSVSLIRLSLERYIRMDLAKKLLSRLAPSDHPEIIAGRILHNIVLKLTAEDALESVTRIISSCVKSGCKKCLSYFLDEVNWTIIAAARQGNVQLVRFLFQHVMPSTQILSAAIRGGNSELIEFILAQNPNIRQAPSEAINMPEMDSALMFWDYTTPLAEAIETRDELLIKRLESKGALENMNDLSIVNTPRIPTRFETALWASLRAGNMAYMEKLLSSSTVITSDAAVEALSEAVKKRREDMVRLLLSWGIFIDGPVRLKYIMVVVELYKWNMPLLSEIIATFPGLSFSYGFMDSIEDELELEPLHLLDFLCDHNFLYSNHLNIIYKVIVERSDTSIFRHAHRVATNINCSNDLLMATKGRPDALRKLIARIASSPETIHQFGTRAVVEAIKHGDTESFDILIACKAVDLKYSIHDHGTPLEIAIRIDAARYSSHFPLTSKLLDAGCDVNESAPPLATLARRRQRNTTPLLRAIGTGNKDLVQFLIDRGAKVNQEAIHGIIRTPLQMAAETADFDMTELLLRNGAEVSAKPSTYMGGTALQMAAIGGNCNIAVLLIDRGATIYEPPSIFDGRWPLEGAAEHGRVDMIQFLWNVSLGGFPVTQCRKAIELAEKNEHRACRDLIRELAASSGIMLTLENSG